MGEYDDFVERLEGALGDEEGREDFLEYLLGMTPEQRAELLAEAERRDPDGAAEWEQNKDGPPAARKNKKPKAAEKGGKR